MSSLNVQEKYNSHELTPFELTYHLTPWSCFAFNIHTKGLSDLTFDLTLFEHPSLKYIENGNTLVALCMDHSIDALSLLNCLKGHFYHTELRLVTDKTRFKKVNGNREIFTSKQTVKVLLNRKQTSKFIESCHAKKETVTSQLVQLFRKPNTPVAIATNLRKQLNVPAGTIGNLSGGLNFKAIESVTSQTIKSKLESGENINELINLLNTHPLFVTWGIRRLNRAMLNGSDHTYPRLIVSNLGAHEISWVDYMHFVPPAVPLVDVLTLGIVTVNGQMSIVLASRQPPEFTSDEVIRILENVCA